MAGKSEIEEISFQEGYFLPGPDLPGVWGKQNHCQVLAAGAVYILGGVEGDVR